MRRLRKCIFKSDDQHLEKSYFRGQAIEIQLRQLKNNSKIYFCLILNRQVSFTRLMFDINVGLKQLSSKSTVTLLGRLQGF